MCRAPYHKTSATVDPIGHYSRKINWECIDEMQNFILCCRLGYNDDEVRSWCQLVRHRNKPVQWGHTVKYWQYRPADWLSHLMTQKIICTVGCRCLRYSINHWSELGGSVFNKRGFARHSIFFKDIWFMGAKFKLYHGLNFHIIFFYFFLIVPR